MKSSSVTALLLLLVLLLASSSEASITCNEAVGYLEPCLTYLKGGLQKPSVSCCVGVKSLVSAVENPDDKRTACSCIKEAAQITRPIPENAEALPENCGISLPVTVSPSLDCSKIS